MNLKLSVIIIIFPLFILSSCDPGYGVYIENKTDKEISVKVILSDNQRPLNFRNDSVSISDRFYVDSIGYWYSIRAIKDSSDNSYNFRIPEFKIACFEGGQGAPDYNQKIIVNAKENLSFRSREHLKKTGSFMSKSFIFTIN